MKPLRVCIEARMPGGTAGGIENLVACQAAGLSSLDDGDEEYVFLTVPAYDDWLLPHIAGRCETLPRLDWPGAQDGTTDQLIKSLNVDLVHFPFQRAFPTDVPSIYQPHDLQHRHLPELFSSQELATRDAEYPLFCNQASRVIVANDWTRNDVIDQLGLAPGKIAVMPTLPALNIGGKPAPDQIERVRAALALPNEFVLYPAQTWAHKNHVNLLKALAVLRARGLTIPLLCAGLKNAFYPVIDRAIAELNLERLVTFTGLLPNDDVNCLYALARAVVIPSRFEGACLPMVEAFATGTPIVCSNATCLPEVAGDAAMLFDPEDPCGIADAIERVWTDENVRREFITRGRRRASSLTWTDIARRYRAHYRDLAGRELTAEDRALLATD